MDYVRWQMGRDPGGDARLWPYERGDFAFREFGYEVDRDTKLLPLLIQKVRDEQAAWDAWGTGVKEDVIRQMLERPKPNVFWELGKSTMGGINHSALSMAEGACRQMDQGVGMIPAESFLDSDDQVKFIQLLEIKRRLTDEGAENGTENAAGVARVDAQIEELRKKGATGRDFLTDSYAEAAEAVGEKKARDAKFYAPDPEFAGTVLANLSREMGRVVPEAMVSRVPVLGAYLLQTEAYQIALEDAQATAARNGVPYDEKVGQAYAMRNAALAFLATQAKFDVLFGKWWDAGGKRLVESRFGQVMARVLMPKSLAGRSVRDVLASTGINVAQGGLDDYFATMTGVENRNPFDMRRRAGDAGVAAATGTLLRALLLGAQAKGGRETTFFGRKEGVERPVEFTREIGRDNYQRQEKVFEIDEATMPREAFSLKGAIDSVLKMVGKAIRNRQTGLEASVSKASLKKMTSESAVKKSASPQTHALAVANVDRLFQEAELLESHPDRGNDQNIKAIHRFYAPMVYDGQVYAVKITVKESANTGNSNRIYSVEAIDVEKAKLAGQSMSIPAQGLDRSIPIASFNERLRQLEEKVKTNQGARSSETKTEKGVQNLFQNEDEAHIQGQTAQEKSESGKQFKEDEVPKENTPSKSWSVDPEAQKAYEKIINEASSTLPGTLADQARTFQVAAKAIDGGGGAETGGGTSAAGRGRNVARWAEENGRLVSESEIASLPIISETTSEHQVHFREVDNRAIKQTRELYYGQVPAPEDGKLGGREASIDDYLRRMALQIAVFHDDIRLEGIVVPRDSLYLKNPADAPRVVISQQWYESRGKVTREAVGKFLGDEGFVGVSNSFNGWVRFADGVVILDASPDNFILTEAGLVPVDLQMTVFSPDQLRAAGLLELNK